MLTREKNRVNEKRDKKSAILVNLLELGIRSNSSDIMHELWGE